MNTPAASEGWYQDPDQPDRQRYWDGTRWTDAMRDQMPVPQQLSQVDDGKMPGIAVAGYIFAVLAPLIGLILGIITGVKHRPPAKNHGPWIIGLSIVLFFLYIIILLSLDTSTTTTTDYGTYQ